MHRARRLKPTALNRVGEVPPSAFNLQHVLHVEANRHIAFRRVGGYHTSKSVSILGKCTLRAIDACRYKVQQQLPALLRVLLEPLRASYIPATAAGSPDYQMHRHKQQSIHHATTCYLQQVAAV